MFAAWTTLGSIALVTSLNSRTCSPATEAVEAAIKQAAPIRNLEKQVRLLRMIILPRAPVTVSNRIIAQRTVNRELLDKTTSLACKNWRCRFQGTWLPCIGRNGSLACMVGPQ